MIERNSSGQRRSPRRGGRATMGSKRWMITLDGFEHAVTAEHRSWSGKVAITVDGVRVARSCSSLGGVTARDFPFIFAGHNCYVRSTTNGFTCKHELIVDGRPVETGAPRGGQLPMPSWAWAFIVACGLMAKAGGLLGVPL